MDPVPPTAPSRLTDEFVRVIIFIFGMVMAAFFLFRYNGFLSMLIALPFLIVGGNAMRMAFFPYGKIVESLFWLVAAGIGLFAALLFRAFGDRDSSGVAIVLAVLFAYSVYDTYRSIRFARNFNALRKGPPE